MGKKPCMGWRHRIRERGIWYVSCLDAVFLAYYGYVRMLMDAIFTRLLEKHVSMG